MFRIHSTSPKNGKPGRLKIREVTCTHETGLVDRVLIDIETKCPQPFRRAVKHKTGKFAKLVRQKLLEAGLSEAQCNIILKTGIYDERNGGLHHWTPEQLLSKKKSVEAQIREKTKRYIKAHDSSDLAPKQQ